MTDEGIMAEIENYLIDSGLATDEVFGAIYSIFGYNLQNANDILFYFTGYRDFDKLVEDEEWDG